MRGFGMKKSLSIIAFLIVIVGCSADIANNPTSPQENSKAKDNLISEKISSSRITSDDVLPEALKFLEKKQRELNIKINPDQKLGNPKIVDITKIPGIVVPTLSEIEKLSPGNEKYFSGHNIKKIPNSSKKLSKEMDTQDEIILNYYSWCVPYPSPEKPFFEYMGSAQTSNIPMDMMDIWSLHYDQGFHYLYDYCDNCQSLSVSDWHDRSESQIFQVVGAHYFYRYDLYYRIEALLLSYAYDGVSNE
jgi:hypothetical protein